MNRLSDSLRGHKFYFFVFLFFCFCLIYYSSRPFFFHIIFFYNYPVTPFFFSSDRSTICPLPIIFIANFYHSLSSYIFLLLFSLHPFFCFLANLPFFQHPLFSYAFFTSTIHFIPIFFSLAKSTFCSTFYLFFTSTIHFMHIFFFFITNFYTYFFLRSNLPFVQ